MHSRPFSTLTRATLGAAVIVALGVAPAASAAVAPAAAPPAPGSPAVAAPAMSQVTAQLTGRAHGTLAVELDFATLTVQPAGGGAKCLLRVDATLGLAGSLAGTATGVTSATIDAPCALATTTPPGTYADTFSFTGSFKGTVSGTPAKAQVLYAGVTRPGGDVSVLLTMHGGATVLAAVQARAGASGTYQGIALVLNGPA